MQKVLLSSFSLALASLTAADLAAAPVLRMKLSDDASQGVKTVSFVKNPAIEKGWVALAAVEVSTVGPKRYHLSTETEGLQAQVLTGPALVPGQKILRLGADKKPFYITFEAEDILAISRRFAAEGNHNNSNQEHAAALSGNVFYESWIVKDSATGEAAALGIDVPAGTWMLSAHIPDADFWEKEVKSGNITGFSIEGLFDQEALTMAAVPAPKPCMKKNWMFSMLVAMAKVAGIKLTKTELKNGTIIDVAEDGTVSDLDPEGNVTGPAKDGSYELADGSTLEVKDGKKVTALADEPKPGTAPAAPDTAGVIKTLQTVVEGGETDTAKLVEAITAAITALGGTAPAVDPTKLSAVELKLEAYTMADGKTINFDPMTRKLTDEAGALLPSGDYKRTDGSCFRVNTDQYCWEIPAADFKGIEETAAAAETAKTDLAAVRTELAAATLKLSALPGAVKLSLGGDGAGAGASTENTEPTGGAPVSLALSRTAQLRALKS
jgi:hypothetical protein